MPHNRIRIWVGLAIAAVTIPAVGYYAVNSQGARFQDRAEGDSVRWTAGGTPVVTPGRVVVNSPERNYQGELDTLLGRSASRYRAEEEAYADPYSDNNPIFDISPYDWPIDEVPNPSRTMGRDLPDPAMEMAPVETEPAPEGPSEEEFDNGPVVDPPLSDRTVYSMMVDGMDEEDRDSFVRTWALMSPEQRADLLDGFRERVETSN